MFTQVFACRDRKHTKVAADHCKIGIVVATALSDCLVYEAAEDGVRRQQKFEFTTTQPVVEERCEDREYWQRVTFRPSAELFQDHKINEPMVKSWSEQLTPPLSTTVKLLVDGRREP